MEIYLDKRAVKQIRISASDAIEEGDTDSLRDDIAEAFPEDKLETLEQMLGGTDFAELLSEILDEWSGDDVDELFELLETQLGDHGVDLKYYSADDEDDDDEDDDDDDLVDDDDDLVDDEEEEDDGYKDYDEFDEPGFDEDL
ncbi:MAG: hypothetical protein R3B72_47295 [Polyangiaceae bacterium]